MTESGITFEIPAIKFLSKNVFKIVSKKLIRKVHRSALETLQIGDIYELRATPASFSFPAHIGRNGLLC